MIFVGVDGGGSGCRAVVCDRELEVLGSGASGPANIATGREAAVANISESIRRALAAAGLPETNLASLPVCLGLAGYNSAPDAETFASATPFERVLLTTDARIALEGAIPHGDGCTAIIGTGTVYAWRRNGETGSTGGWGFTVSDLASGAWLGRQALVETLKCHDGIRQHSQLTLQLLRRYGDSPRAIAEFAQRATPGAFAELASLVVEHDCAGDRVAGELLTQGVQHVREVLDILVPDEETALCFSGGLGSSVYRHRMQKLFAAQIRDPVADPAVGAAMLAVAEFDRR